MLLVFRAVFAKVPEYLIYAHLAHPFFSQFESGCVFFFHSNRKRDRDKDNPPISPGISCLEGMEFLNQKRVHRPNDKTRLGCKGEMPT